MSFPTKLLSPGEEVYLDARPNWSYLFWPSVLVLLVAAVCVAVIVLWAKAPAFMAWVLLGCVVVALCYFAGRYVGWLTTCFVVTSQRIVYRTGALRRTGREIPIGRVQDVTYHQTIVERLVRTGSLTVESAGRQGQEPFPDISRPAEVQSLINRLVTQGMGGYPVPVVQPQPPPVEVSEPVTAPTPRAWIVPPADPEQYPSSPVATPSADLASQPGAVAQRLADLAELHRRGVVTDAEYEQKRRELVDRL